MSTVGTPEEGVELQDGARPYVAICMKITRQQYGPAFDTWPETVKIAAVLNIAVQGLLMPESHATHCIDLDMASYATAMALGTQSLSVPEELVPQLLERIGNGFATGRAESLRARETFKTEGGCN